MPKAHHSALGFIGSRRHFSSSVDDVGGCLSAGGCRWCRKYIRWICSLSFVFPCECAMCERLCSADAEIVVSIEMRKLSIMKTTEAARAIDDRCLIRHADPGSDHMSTLMSFPFP